jgi:hypothetical protein
MLSLFPSLTTSVSLNVFKGFTGLTFKTSSISTEVHGFTALDPQIPPLAQFELHGARSRSPDQMLEV